MGYYRATIKPWGVAYVKELEVQTATYNGVEYSWKPVRPGPESIARRKVKKKNDHLNTMTTEAEPS